MLKQILKDMFRQKGIYTVFMLGILSQGLLVTIPYFEKYYVDFIVNKNMGEKFYFYTTLGATIGIFVVLISYLREYLKEGIIARFEIEKNIYYLKKFLGLDYDYRNNEGSGKTIKKISLGIDAQIRLFNSFYDLIVSVVIRLSMIFIFVFTLYKPLIGLLIVFMFVVIVINTFISKKVKILTDKEQDINENSGRQGAKIIMESNLVNISNKKNYEINNFFNILKDLPNIKKKTHALNHIIHSLLELFFQLASVLVYIFLGRLVVSGELTIGELTVIIAYIWWMWWPIDVILNNIAEYRDQLSKYEALEKFVNKKNKIIDGKNFFKLKMGEIIFDNINFSYTSKKNIFKNFCLKIEGGKTLALVGYSGSGKSTLVKLLLRSYLLDGGKILIDNQNLKDLKISTFYENIGYLSQDPAIFDGSIIENLSYGLKNNTLENEERFWDVLKKVNLYKLVKNSKNTLQAEVGEKGLKLSGGEKQRLAIARIFLKDPKILIFDEPTSSLDSISENKITKIINTVMKSRTVIIIAHRLQTVMQADKIVVINSGKIIESGNHKELIKNNGLYANLVDLQKGTIKN